MLSWLLEEAEEKHPRVSDDVFLKVFLKIKGDPDLHFRSLTCRSSLVVGRSCNLTEKF